MMFRFLRMSASYNVYLWVNIYAKLGIDVMTDGVAEGYNLAACGTAEVDEHKGLLGMDTGVPH